MQRSAGRGPTACAPAPTSCWLFTTAGPVRKRKMGKKSPSPRVGLTPTKTIITM
jgi:hypothetical protein